MQVVWFKRDLRVQDNRALFQACARGDVLPLYVVEPAYWELPDASGRHWEFIAESLIELRDTLGRCGQPLIVRTGDVIDVLEWPVRRVQLNRRHPLTIGRHGLSKLRKKLGQTPW